MWHVTERDGTFTVSDDDGAWHEVPPGDVADLVRALLRSCDARPGEPAAGGHAILAAWRVDDEEMEEPAAPWEPWRAAA